MLVSVFELVWDDFTPPLKAGRRSFFGKGALDETAVKVECGDIGGRVRMTADTIEA